MTKKIIDRQDRLLQFRSHIARKPIIAGLKGSSQVSLSAREGIKVCFYLTGHIFELQELVKQCKEQGQMVFAHVDLISGVAKDNYGMQVLASEIGVDGVLTTRGHLITAAKKAGLLGIQRLFMLDSVAQETGLKMIRANKPDAVEMLPALILPFLRERLPKGLPPIIAGGLVEEKHELTSILKPPVMAVSTSKTDLWKYERE